MCVCVESWSDSLTESELAVVIADVIYNYYFSHSHLQI